MQLSEEQTGALKFMVESVENGPGTVLLQGYAGTGKTVTVVELVRYCQGKSIPIALTAPTNKAVKVLAQKLADAGIRGDVMCCTIHKLLGVKPGNTDEKRPLQKVGDDRSGNYKVVVIDECSMLGEEIMAYINRALRFHALILVGDPQQLPPVGEALSQSFGTRSKAVLATIMRQREDNPIIALTADIRAMIDAGRPDWAAFAPAEGADGVGIHCPGEHMRFWLDSAFTSDDFKENNDAFRYLAWTNETVNQVNRAARAKIYGENADEFVVGERLLFRKPVTIIKDFGYRHSRDMVFSTDEEATIMHIGREMTAGIGPAGPIEVYRLTMENEYGVAAPALVVPREWMAEFKRTDYEFRLKARSDKGLWPIYFNWLEQFAEVQPVYAMTVHRSQGSTFDTVFVDLLDIQKNRNTTEMLKLLYVAASRPRRFLVI